MTRFLKILLPTALFLLLFVVFSGHTAYAASSVRVTSDRELAVALKDKNVSEINIEYTDAVIFEKVSISRPLKITGNKAVISNSGDGFIEVQTKGTLELQNITIAGVEDYLIRSSGKVVLSGGIVINKNFGILILAPGSMESDGSAVTATSSVTTAVGVTTSGGEVSLTGIKLSGGKPAGDLIFIYRSKGTLVFRGSSEIISPDGNAIRSAVGYDDDQSVRIAENASLRVIAEKATNDDGFAAAVFIPELSFSMDAKSTLEVTGSYSGLSVSSLTAAQGCTINAMNTIESNVTRLLHETGAVTIYQKSSSIGADSNLILRGAEGIVLRGSSDLSLGNNCIVYSALSSSGVGDAIHAKGGKVSIGANCRFDGYAPGRIIFAAKDITVGEETAFSSENTSYPSMGGLYSDASVTLQNSSMKVNNLTADGYALYADGSVYLKNSSKLDILGGGGIWSKGDAVIESGCEVKLSGMTKYGIYAKGKVVAGELSTLFIDSFGTCIYSGKSIEFLQGSKATLSVSALEPAVELDAKSGEEGYVLLSGAEVDLSGTNSSNAQRGGLLFLNGNLTVENHSHLRVKSPASFGIYVDEGGIFAKSGGSVQSSAGCGIYIDSGNCEVSGGASLYCMGSLDSGIRIQDGSLSVSEAEIVAQGGRFGAELLGKGDILLRKPTYYDIRSTEFNSVFIDNGKLSVTDTAFSAWYRKDGVRNENTWWQDGANGIDFFEIHTKLTPDRLMYADYTSAASAVSQNYAGGSPKAFDGMAENISAWNPYDCTRIAPFMTRPVALSNLYYLPAGKSFSWMLSGRSVQGGGEKFAVSSILGEGNIYLSEDGKFTYSAPLATRGVQTFEFTVTGSDGAVSLPASLKINVTKSKPPAAYTSTFEVRTNAELLSAVTVTDFDGMINNVEVVDKPTFGELIMSSDGQFKYVPETGFAGTDYFTYVAVDNDGDKSSLATATILVGQTRYCAAFNATHLAARDEVITAGFDYRATALPANNQEATPAEIADVVITQMSLYGTFEADNGGYSYTPYEDFAGTDTIKFKLKFSDKTESEEAIISIITIPSQKPSVFDYSLECIKNRTLSEKLTADDMDGTVAKYEITALPSNGTIELDTTTGEFVYEPSRGYTGADSFSFAVYDNEGLRSNEASVSVEVKTLTQSLRDSGKYFAAVVFVVLGVLAVIVFLALLAVHIVRKRKDEEREYRRQMKKKLH